MEVNITLIVQMLHFGCVYIIVDRVFLRPVFRIVEGEDMQQQELEQQALAQQARIQYLEQQNIQDWIILQKRLRAESPHVTFRRQGVVEEQGVTTQLSSEKDLQPFITSLEQEIVKKVLHDD